MQPVKWETKKNINKPYKCIVEGCNKVFRNSVDLKNHLQAHRADTGKRSYEEFASKKIYKCDKVGCNETFTTLRSLISHKQREERKCNEPGCEEAFQRLDQLMAHKRDKHSGERPFKCDHEGCDKTYKALRHLCRHKISSHSSTDRHFICGEEDCGKIFTDKYVLQKHIATIHRASNNTQTKKASDAEKKHKCDVVGCNAAFYRPYRLQNHKLVAHGGEKPFKCNYEGCDKSYTNESHLKRHKNKSHFSEIDTTKEVICEVEGCGLILLDNYNLKKHVARRHIELPFACQECNKKFKRKSQLHAHKIEEHGGEAPYKCDRCSREFILSSLFNTHMKKHKTYQCDCSKVFEKWSKLMEHRKTECALKKKKYKCTICEKTFALKNALTQHSLLVHVPDSQIDFIKCPYLNCKYSYKYSSSLRYHIQTYHEKIFNKIKCTETNCEMEFKSNKNLKQHLRTIHSGLPPKVRKPRRPRKDKGKPKKSMASKLSGHLVSTVENYKNIRENMDVSMQEQVLKIDIISVTKTKDPKFRICEEVSATIVNNDQEEDAAETDLSDKAAPSLAVKSNVTKSRIGAERNAAQVSDNQEEETETNVSETEVALLTDTETTLKNCNTTSTSVVSMEIDSACSKIPNILEVGLVRPDGSVSKSMQNTIKIADSDYIAKISSEVQTTTTTYNIAKSNVTPSRIGEERNASKVSDNQEEETETNLSETEVALLTDTETILKNCNTTSTSVVSMEIDSDCSKIPNMLKVGLVTPGSRVSTSKQNTINILDGDHIVKISSEVQNTTTATTTYNISDAFGTRGSDEQCMVDKQVISNPIEVSHVNSTIKSIDTSTVTCGKDNDLGLVIFDFPEFENADNKNE